MAQSAGNHKSGNGKVGSRSAGNGGMGNRRVGKGSAGNKGVGNSGAGHGGTGNSDVGYRGTVYKCVSNKRDGKAGGLGRTRKPGNPDSNVGEFGSGIRARKEDGMGNPGCKTNAVYEIKKKG